MESLGGKLKNMAVYTDKYKLSRSDILEGWQTQEEW